MPALDQHKSENLYPLRPIRNERDYHAAMESMEMVFDETDGELADYAETLSILIEKYEDDKFPMEQSSSVDMLKFLMEQNGLKQKDLVGILGGKSTVSEILKGKRDMNLRHVRKLAEYFNVKPATFV